MRCQMVRLWYESKTNFKMILYTYYGQMLRAKETEQHKNLRHHNCEFIFFFFKASNLFWNPEMGKRCNGFNFVFVTRTMYPIHLLKIQVMVTM
jgi:hypothetical protein